MFKFDFDIEDTDVAVEVPRVNRLSEATSLDSHVLQETFSEISLAQLLDALPNLISYSPLSIPLSSGAHVVLARRDLFDARFQLIAGDESDAIGETVGGTDVKEPRNVQSALEFLDSPSDLVPGLYEGGLKTWECSLDLVDCLDSFQKSQGICMDIRGKRVLEVGCGTAVPSLYLLSRLFASDLKNDGVKTQTHLQDYNASVLELVTLPNIILAWYMSPSSESYRNLQSLDSVAAFDPSSPGELQLSPALKVAFLESLHTHGIALRFYAGSWDTFNLDHAGGKYDLVLSSETIYRTESLNSLIGLMEGACGCGRGRSEIPLDELTSSRLSLAQLPPRYLCLVAAKLLYFGVGGGISEFVCAIEKLGHGRVEVETVWERKVGVGRRVLRIEWGK